MSLSKRKRLHSFSIRATLVVTGCFAIWFAYLLREDRMRRELVTAIEEAGGEVTLDDGFRITLFESARVAEVRLPHSAIERLPLSRLKNFPNLVRLNLTDIQIPLKDGSRIDIPTMLFDSAKQGDFLEQLGDKGLTITPEEEERQITYAREQFEKIKSN